MTITVNTATRTAVIASPAVFAAGEATPVTITGTTATLASLKLLLTLTDGTALALCETFTESPSGTFAGTLDLRTAAVVAAFVDKRTDERIPAILALADASRLWVCQGVEVAGNPLASTPVAPEPVVRADVYVLNSTTGLFHLVRASANDLGEVTLTVVQEGIARAP